MASEKLSRREAELVAQARQEAEARKAGMPLPANPAVAHPAGAGPNPTPATTPRSVHDPAPQSTPEKRTATPQERLARLMAEERAESERRKRKMRRYGIVIPAAIVALFTLWLLRASRPRR
jgi:hypothetical protein